ncbi:MAG: hypothetical protein GC159_10130 [Phycisphaera sp.]|nr:hypothetical protein [Phycisphaera sp.]
MAVCFLVVAHSLMADEGSGQKDAAATSQVANNTTQASRETADGVVLKILRPKLKGEQVSPTWTELNYVMIDARHPNGIAKLQLWKPGAKKAEASLTEADRHRSGYFFLKRRFKSGGDLDFKILCWPKGADPNVDPPITSDATFLLQYRDPKPKIPDYLGFTNLGDGSVVNANDPTRRDDLTYIYLDCMDSSGTWGEGTFKEMHVGYRDDDGIKWVELVIDGPDGQTVLHNDRAFITERDEAYYGPYWGQAVDPKQTKKPEEAWPAGVKWKPIEGFGLYEFAVPLKPGAYKLSIRARNNDDKTLDGPSISITARSAK